MEAFDSIDPHCAQDYNPAVSIPLFPNVLLFLKHDGNHCNGDDSGEDDKVGDDDCEEEGDGGYYDDDDGGE